MPDIGNMPDVPALSATSDVPAIDPPAPPPVVEPLPSDPPSDPPIAEPPSDGDPPAADPPSPARNGVSERLSKMARDRDVARAERDTAADTLAKALAIIERFSVPQPAGQQTTPAPVVSEPRPTRDQFDDPDAYDTALVEWSQRGAARVAAAEVDRRMAEQRQADERARIEEAATRQRQEVEASWATRRDAFITEHEDFLEVAADPSLAITNDMTVALMNDEHGPGVLYHLAKNPAEAERIAALNPLRQVIEIGRLSARLEASAAPPPRRLPQPIEPVNGNRNAAGPKSLNEMSTEEYAAKRMPELRAERRASMWGRPRE